MVNSGGIAKNKVQLLLPMTQLNTEDNGMEGKCWENRASRFLGTVFNLDEHCPTEYNGKELEFA